MKDKQFLLSIEGWKPFYEIYKVFDKEKTLEFLCSSMPIPADIVEKGDRTCLLYVYFTKPYTIPESILKYNPKFLKCATSLQDNFWIVHPPQYTEYTPRMPIFDRGRFLKISNILEVNSSKYLFLFEPYDTNTTDKKDPKNNIPVLDLNKKK